MSKFLTFALVIVALTFGIGIGYVLTPGYSIEENMPEDLGTADRYFDLRFMNAMIAHHNEAIEMAKEGKEKSKRSEIFNLANNIIDSQEKENLDMNNWRKDWYDNTASIENVSDSVNLGEYDEKFDLRFMNAMIAHHDMAVEMSMEAQRKSSRNEVLNLADSIIIDQSKEMEQMMEWREEWYNIK